MAFCVNLAHSASVPIAVHLDHATTEHDIDTALTFAERGTAFDSIMVDASHADSDEENLEEVSLYTRFCANRRDSPKALVYSAVDIRAELQRQESLSKLSSDVWREEKPVFESSPMLS